MHGHRRETASREVPRYAHAFCKRERADGHRWKMASSELRAMLGIRENRSDGALWLLKLRHTRSLTLRDRRKPEFRRLGCRPQALLSKGEAIVFRHGRRASSVVLGSLAAAGIREKKSNVQSSTAGEKVLERRSRVVSSPRRPASRQTGATLAFTSGEPDLEDHLTSRLDRLLSFDIRVLIDRLPSM